MLLDEIYKKVIFFLNKEKFNYLVIGGIAAGVLGEPRVTGDVDIDILIDKKDVKNFLDKSKKYGFKFDEQVSLKRTNESGSFQVFLGDFHIDFIITSTEFEKDAHRRKIIIKFKNIEAYFPTPEDFILLKIVPNRPIDIIDAEKVAIRNSGKLDEKYLIKWAQILSDQAEDLRIYKEVKRLLKL